MKALLARIERRFIKAKLAKSEPESLIRMGHKWLLPSFRRAAKQSPAYRILLAESGVDVSAIKTPEDFVARCPLLEKSNTFKRFPIAELICDDIPPSALASVLTSSGHGAGGYALGMSTHKQFRGSARLIDLGLEMAFGIDTRRTLLINCLPMGVTFNSNAVCVANVSVREDMACAIFKQAGSLFEQVILCGDPLFLKRLCDYSQSIGIDWSHHRIHVIVGEETFPETFRDYLASVLGVKPDDVNSGLIGSSMGVGELGLNLFNETRETVALRRACMRDPVLLKRLTGVDIAVSPAPTFMVFNPLRSFIEVINRDQNGVGDLVVTMMDETTPIPLMRYSTGDRMQLISRATLQEVAKTIPGGLSLPSAPMIVLHGRAKDRLTGGGHVDLFKEALYRKPEIARHISGAHRISIDGETVRWEVQAVRGDDADRAALSRQLHTDIATRLPGRQVVVIVHDYDAFPYGRIIDYERKFVYWVPPA
jgi:phenylacetate-CoA ligase